MIEKIVISVGKGRKKRKIELSEKEARDLYNDLHDIFSKPITVSTPIYVQPIRVPSVPYYTWPWVYSQSGTTTGCATSATGTQVYCSNNADGTNNLLSWTDAQTETKEIQGSITSTA